MKPTIKSSIALNALSYEIIGLSYKIHSKLGPGLLESVYETCLEYELQQAGIHVGRQLSLPVIYEEIEISTGYRVDLLVENSIILEIKSLEAILSVHEAQLMTYLKLSSLKLGLLLNFNVASMKKGIHRIIM